MVKPVLSKCKIDILGHTWEVKFLSGEAYEKVHGNSSRAVTITGLKQIHFNVAAVHYKDNVAVHELVHAYSHEFFFHDIKLGEDLTEEFYCVLFEVRGAELLAKAKPLTTELHRLAKRLRAKVKPYLEEEDD